MNWGATAAESAKRVNLTSECNEKATNIVNHIKKRRSIYGNAMPKQWNAPERREK